MSSSSFDPVSFLMKISPAMLMEYAARHEIDLKLKEEWENTEEYANHVLRFLDGH
jgi:hypothetical protein